MSENPWKVKSIEAFVCLKCPECEFNTKEETFFIDHAVEKHPLSFELFVDLEKIEKEEVDHFDLAIRNWSIRSKPSFFFAKNAILTSKRAANRELETFWCFS